MLLGVFCPGMHVGMPGYSKSASVGGLGEAASVYSPMRERMGCFVFVSDVPRRDAAVVIIALIFNRWPRL